MIRIYYAHPMSWYDTPEEAADIAALTNYGKVVNPNTKFFRDMVDRAKRDNYPVMQLFADFIKDEADVVAFRAFRSGKIGSGVYREVMEAAIWDKKIWQVNNSMGSGELFVDTSPLRRHISLRDVLTVEETKRRILNHEL